VDITMRIMIEITKNNGNPILGIGDRGTRFDFLST
jgi:hypothetical protein